MMKTRKILAVLTACAALTSSMAIHASAENTDAYAYKTTDYLIEKYYYDDNLFWNWIEKSDTWKYTMAGVREADMLIPIYEDENGNPCTIEEAGWVAAGYWSNPYRYQYAGCEAQYVNCEKSGAFYYVVKEDGMAMIIGGDLEMIAEMGDTLEIPDELDGCVVNELGANAFQALSYKFVSNIKKVVVPDSIEIIRKNALSGAVPADSPAGSINLPKNVKYLGYNAYGNLGTALGDVLVLPESLEFLSHGAFTCTYIWAVDYPDTPFIAQGGGLMIDDLKDYYIKNIAAPYDEEKETNFDYLLRVHEGYYAQFDQYLANPGLTVPVALDPEGNPYDEECYWLPECAFNSISSDETCTSQHTVVFAESLLFMTGDLNNDDAVSIADLTLLSRFVAEDNTLSVTAHGKANADVNRDGEINAGDINSLAMKLTVK